MPSDEFGPGDTFWCKVIISNPGSETLTDVPVFVLLEIDNVFYFAPEFDDFAYYSMPIPPGESTLDVIPAFTWPDNAGEMTGAVWWAAMTDAGITRLFGAYDRFEFSWHE